MNVILPPIRNSQHASCKRSHDEAFPNSHTHLPKKLARYIIHQPIEMSREADLESRHLHLFADIAADIPSRTYLEASSRADISIAKRMNTVVESRSTFSTPHTQQREIDVRSNCTTAIQHRYSTTLTPIIQYTDYERESESTNDPDVESVSRMSLMEIDQRVVKLSLPDHSMYYGSTQNGLPHGRGRKIYPDGRIYEGGFQDGKCHGYGKLTKLNGLYYEGQFQNDLPHGNGRCTISTGGTYVGEFRNGYRNGRGKLTFHDGSVYIGEFQNNTFHGKGRLKNSNQRSFEGQFSNGLFHGIGKLTNLDGSFYEGIWQNGYLKHLSKH